MTAPFLEPGAKILSGGRQFTAIAVEPYTRRDGAPSQLVTWRGHCVTCSAPFETKGSRSGHHLAVNCPEHRVRQARRHADGAAQQLSDKGRWSFTDFSAPRLSRAMSVATDGEWEEARKTHGPRWLEELLKHKDPTVMARLREHLGVLSTEADPFEAGLHMQAKKPENGA